MKLLDYDTVEKPNFQTSGRSVLVRAYSLFLSKSTGSENSHKKSVLVLLGWLLLFKYASQAIALRITAIICRTWSSFVEANTRTKRMFVPTHLINRLITILFPGWIPRSSNLWGDFEYFAVWKPSGAWSRADASHVYQRRCDGHVFLYEWWGRGEDWTGTAALQQATEPLSMDSEC